MIIFHFNLYLAIPYSWPLYKFFQFFCLWLMLQLSFLFSCHLYWILPWKQMAVGTSLWLLIIIGKLSYCLYPKFIRGKEMVSCAFVSPGPSKDLAYKKYLIKYQVEFNKNVELSFVWQAFLKFLYYYFFSLSPALEMS